MPSSRPQKSRPSWQILDIPKRKLDSDISSVAINDSEFLVQTKGKAFQKYDVIEDEWSRYPISVPKQLKGKRWKIKAYDPTTKSLYVVDNESKRLTAFDVQTGSIHSVSSELPLWTDTIFLIGDKLHIFGRRNSFSDHYRHFILDKQLENNQSFDHKPIVMNETEGRYAFVHSKARDSILYLVKNGREPVIAEYSLSTKQWNMRQCDVSYDSLRYLKAVCSVDGRYLITLKRAVISICDLNESALKLKRVGVRKPANFREYQEFHLLLMRDKWEEEMATFGFVSLCFDGEEMKEVQHLPRYIIELIAKWVEMEYIHLMQTWNYQIRHWKMSIKEILEFAN